MAAGVEGWGRDSPGVWDGRGHTAVFNMENQQGPAVQHRELWSILCAGWMGGVFGGEWKHVHVWLSASALHLKLSQHYESTISQYKIKDLKKKQTNHVLHFHNFSSLRTCQLGSQCPG